MSQLAALHCHSEFSARDSLVRVAELPRVAAERGWDAVALTDHGGIEGAPRFVDACEEVGIKPIVGCEVYVSVPDSKKAHHLTILTKNANGFSSLCGVLSYAHRNFYDGRRRNAATPIYYLMDHLDDCVVLSGCASSPFWRDSDSTMIELGAWVDKFGEDFFFEVQALHDWPTQVALNRQIMGIAQRHKRPVVVTPDCHFATPEEGKFHDALLAVASYPRVPMSSPKAWRFSTKMNYIMTPNELVENLTMAGLSDQESRSAVLNTQLVSERTERWSWDDLPKPTLPQVADKPKRVLIAHASVGLWEDKGAPVTQEYERRLLRELHIFNEAGLAPYFLLVRECVELFRKEGAEIGPRGSVGGSLVAYALGLTALDPIKHGLSFERFYAPGRRGWPDIDIDIDDEFRKRVPEVLRQRFGEDKVAQISTISTFGVRMAVRDAAKAYDINVDRIVTGWEEEEDAEKIEDIPSGQYLAYHHPEAAEFARRLVGRVRHFGAHPGGFIISEQPLTFGRSCLVRRGKDTALCWNMAAAEKLGFVKLDFLGISSLNAVKEAASRAGIDWSKVPLDIAQVYTDLSEGRTAAVPQFHTSGMRVFLEMLRPEKFSDLVWANAAFRPGGLSDQTPEQLVARFHRDPDSLFIFQEDVMQCCVILAGFSWTDADGVRKIISKSKGREAIEAWRSRFVEGCRAKKTLTPEEASALWDTFLEFGSYGFNRAHSTAYTWNGYRIAAAKRLYPVETFTALLNVVDGQIEELIDESDEFGVHILDPHVNESAEKEWIITPDGIRPPLSRLPGFDGRIAKCALRRRDKDGPFADIENFRKRMGKVKYPPRAAEAAFGLPLSDALPVLNPKAVLPANYRAEVKACEECELRGNCRAPVPPELGKTNILIVGEAPGRDEDRRGRPFVGRSGQLLEACLEKYGVPRKELTWTNTVKCLPPNPTALEAHMAKCTWVDKEIEFLKPPLIFAVGRKAWNRIGEKGGILKANGKVLDKGASRVVASVHPAWVLRNHRAGLPELERAVKRFAREYRRIRGGSYGMETQAMGKAEAKGTH